MCSCSGFPCSGFVRIGPEYCFIGERPDHEMMQLPKAVKIALAVIGFLAVLAGILALTGVPGIEALGLAGGAPLVIVGAVLFLLAVIPIKIIRKEFRGPSLEESNKTANPPVGTTTKIDSKTQKHRNKLHGQAANILATVYNNSLKDANPSLYAFIGNPHVKQDSGIQFAKTISVALQPTFKEGPYAKEDREFLITLRGAYPHGINEIKQRLTSAQRESFLTLNQTTQYDEAALNGIIAISFTLDQPEMREIVYHLVLYSLKRRFGF